MPPSAKVLNQLLCELPVYMCHLKIPLFIPRKECMRGKTNEIEINRIGQVLPVNEDQYEETKLKIIV